MPQGDILFLRPRNRAGGEVGETLLTRIGASSDADVAASDDLTGRLLAGAVTGTWNTGKAILKASWS